MSRVMLKLECGVWCRGLGHAAAWDWKKEEECLQRAVQVWAAVQRQLSFKLCFKTAAILHHCYFSFSPQGLS